MIVHAILSKELETDTVRLEGIFQSQQQANEVMEGLINLLGDTRAYKIESRGLVQSYNSEEF